MILTCIAIGLAPAFKMRFWNVGAEGQMLIGGIATAFFMINFSGKMPVVLLFCLHDRLRGPVRRHLGPDSGLLQSPMEYE